MRLLLDTHLLLWALTDHPQIQALKPRLLDEANECFFSVASLWEVAIKKSLGKLPVTAEAVRSGSLESGFQEIEISFAHVQALVGLPHHHRDPFDRLLVAQSIAEPIRLLTSDATVAQYGGNVELV